jgi:fermentation-respiration switch protein FrsA (DUF1100 family)
MRYIRFFVLSLVAMATIPLIMLYAFQNNTIFPAPRLAVFPDFPRGFERVEIETRDGEKLFGLFHPAPAGRPTIIVFHGNGDAAVFQQAKADTLSRAGFGVLLAEYRGYPGSTGKPSEAGLVVDARAVYDFVRARTDEPVGLYGHSLGAAVAVNLAAERDVYALVLESPFDSLLAVAGHNYPWVPAKERLLRYHFRSDLTISDVEAPILMIHGAEDQIVPVEHGRRLADLAGLGAEFTEIPRAGHNDLTHFGSIEMAVDFFDGKGEN